ncbi:hypothetical protein chiPu_0019492 [Chiloscyllium punctatum]|uniref:Uncharacterized protein n=1 Tax=Chiloscyllium punctatum TaxID=137246 RepID=A0A401RS13_CHIPU|nr:hypothetical protein [Chiloscyllium punctatum]
MYEIYNIYIFHSLTVSKETARSRRSTTSHHAPGPDQPRVKGPNLSATLRHRARGFRSLAVLNGGTPSLMLARLKLFQGRENKTLGKQTQFDWEPETKRASQEFAAGGSRAGASPSPRGGKAENRQTVVNHGEKRAAQQWSRK